MELGHVSIATMMGIYFTTAIAFLLPIALLIYVRKKHKAFISSFFFGAAVFIASAMMLEQILHMVVILVFGQEIQQNVIFTAIYGGFAAALFEETGRFLAMKFLMKNRLNYPNALMYGAGHGGIEAMLVVGITSISNIVMASLVNAGSLGIAFEALDDATKQQALEQISQLWTLPSYQFYMGGLERVFAIAIQIAMTLFMYEAVKRKKIVYGIVAYLAHFTVDCGTYLLSKEFSVLVTELVVGVASIVLILLAYKCCKREDANDVEETLALEATEETKENMEA